MRVRKAENKPTIYETLSRLYYNSGKIYNNFGQIVDVETGALLANLPVSGAICPDIARNRIYVARRGTAPLSAPYAPVYVRYTIETYDATQLTLLGSRDIDLPQPPFFLYDVKRLIRWGDNGLAFCTKDGRGIILDNAP